MNDKVNVAFLLALSIDSITKKAHRNYISHS